MIAGILATAAPVIFRLLEKKFGPKTGETKMAVAADVFDLILGKLATAGKLGEPVPAKEQLVHLLEGLLSGEKQKSDWHEQGMALIAGKRFIVEIIGEVK
jgi:hypothetical protein